MIPNMLKVSSTAFYKAFLAHLILSTVCAADLSELLYTTQETEELACFQKYGISEFTGAFPQTKVSMEVPSSSNTFTHERVI